MSTLSYKTVSANRDTANKKWLLIDAEGEIVGRLASVAAKLLRGKHKTNYTPHVDCGDNIVIINAGKVRFTGKKLTEKEYVRHTGYPGGQRFTTPKQLFAKRPCAVVEHAIKGMLPKTKLGNALYRNLYVYEGVTHNQTAQQPQLVSIKDIK
jgi:large subunit ribosomal protein L13